MSRAGQGRRAGRKSGQAAAPPSALHQLAESYGVQTAYEGVRGRRVEATPDALMAALRALGAPVERPEAAADALRARQQALWQRPSEPVAVAWDGRTEGVPLRLPESQAAGVLSCRLELEGGESRSWPVAASDLPVTEEAEVEGVAYRAYRLPLPGPLPAGYHRLHVEAGGQRSECLILAAPRKACGPEPGSGDRAWGVFLPLYALRTARDWGAGDFTDLESLFAWVHGLGGGLVGTLPLLPAFLDDPCEPSPYSPASRLYWNELYLDVERVPELQHSAAARDLLASADFRKEKEALRAAPLVEYGRLAALKRRVLEPLAESFFREPSARRDEFEHFVAAHPRLADYAAFRAVGERFGRAWRGWPERLREGTIREGDCDEKSRRYHLYVQWLAEEQLSRLAEKARAGGTGLYLDLPLGVNADSYDVWRERASFAQGMAGGAPPDAYFPNGQDWGFPPPNPEHLRADGYRYARACLHHVMRFAGMLRIDHLMGLHRLYWVPQGPGARHGVYVRYRADELYAVFSLESNRHRTVLVGEDLGTVPPEVRPAMAEHNVRRMYVVQYELKPDQAEPLPAPYAGAVAGVNTHDMPTFTAYWKGFDMADRLDLGLLDEEGVRREEKDRQVIRQAVARLLREGGQLGDKDDVPGVLRGLLTWLAESEASVLLANLEDLWQATEPQNVPGTCTEWPNWRRKARHPLEEFDQVPGLRKTLLSLREAVCKGLFCKGLRR
jgi:4-alpha-glucanotransferase